MSPKPEQENANRAITRRTFTRGLGVATLAGGLTGVGGARALAQTLSGSSPVPLARPRAQRAIIGVDISNHPVPGINSGSFPNLATVLDFDQRWLDQQAKNYWSEYAQHLGRPLNEFDRADFWFRYVAIPLQKKALRGGSLGTRAGRVEKDLALMHMVGYYGGIWFFKKLEQFTGKDQTAACPPKGKPTAGPTNETFAPMSATLRAAIAAARTGGDGEALEYAENALRGGDIIFYLSNGLPTLNGLIGSYSYNVGYTNAILVPDNRAFPPPVNPPGPSPFSPPWNSFEFTSNGVFDATYPVWADPNTAATKAPLPPDPSGFTPVPYLIGDTPAMALARARFTAAQNEHPQDFLRIRQGLLGRNGQPVARGDLSVLAQAAFNTGTATWTAPGLLDVRMWDKASYDLIIALSVFFVQAVQSAGQACMASAAASNPLDARNAIMDTAVALPFGLSYLIGAGQRTNEFYACRTADECVPPFVLARR